MSLFTLLILSSTQVLGHLYSRDGSTKANDDGAPFFPFNTCQEDRKKLQKDPSKFVDCVLNCPAGKDDGCEAKCLENLGYANKCAKCTEQRGTCLADFYGHNKKCMDENHTNEDLVDCVTGAMQTCNPGFLTCVDGAKEGQCGVKMVSCAYEGSCQEQCSITKILNNAFAGYDEAMKAQGQMCRACVQAKCKPGYDACVGSKAGSPKLGASYDPAFGTLDYTDGGNWAHMPYQAFEVPTSPQAGGFLSHGGEDQPCRFAPFGVFVRKCDYGLGPAYAMSPLPDAYGSIHGENFSARTCTCQPNWYGSNGPLYRRLERLQEGGLELEIEN